MRKLSTLKERREIHKRSKISIGLDLRSPLERVLEILNGLRDQIDTNEKKIVEDLNYCIKIISSNQLYEAKLDYDEMTDQNSKTEVHMLLNTYSKGISDDKTSKTNTDRGPS